MSHFSLARSFVGAVFGLLVVLVGESGWTALKGKPLELRGAASFAAGFSEPLALGLVTRSTDTLGSGGHDRRQALASPAATRRHA